jgi:hypothetical protein
MGTTKKPAARVKKRAKKKVVKKKAVKKKVAKKKAAPKRPRATKAKTPSTATHTGRDFASAGRSRFDSDTPRKKQKQKR